MTAESARQAQVLVPIPMHVGSGLHGQRGRAHCYTFCSFLQAGVVTGPDMMLVVNVLPPLHSNRAGMHTGPESPLPPRAAGAARQRLEAAL